MAGLTKKKDVWWAIFRIDGRQKWVKIGSVSKTTAREILRGLEETYAKKRYGLLDEKNVSFKSYSEEYLKYSKTNKAERTYERDITSLNSLLRYFENSPLPSISGYQIEQFKTARLEEGVSPRTVNIELRCLSHMFNKAVEWNYLRESPFKGVKLLRYEKKPPRFLSWEESGRLIECASPWLRPIIIFMIHTGVREGERMNLKFEDLDFENKTITIKKTKGKRFRVIPMHKEAEEVLKFLRKNYVLPYVNSHEYVPRKQYQMEYVFCNEDGSPVQSIRKAFANACRKAGISGASPHTLRHTFASHLVMSTVDLRTVQELLGHNNITTTMMYSHLSQSHKEKSVGRLDFNKHVKQNN